jgi:hypothetical protein
MMKRMTFLPKGMVWLIDFALGDCSARALPEVPCVVVLMREALP